MQTRKLGNTGLDVPVVSFGASSLGQEFRQINVDEGLRCVRVALDCGMNYIDTSPFYGRGMSEVLLGIALREVPRDSYILSSKLGRYTAVHFDFSARRVAESVDVTLERLHTDYVDIMFMHDIEFVDMAQIVEETLPALRKVQQEGKVRFVGLSGYPMKIFEYVLAHADLDVILSFNQYHLQNRKLLKIVPMLKEKEVGIINAGPFSARLLTNAPLPSWHRDPPEVHEAARRAAEHCREKGVDIAKLALQFAIANEDLATTLAGSANPKRVAQWAEWAAEPMDTEPLAEVEQIFAPVRDVGHVSGRPENN